MATMSIGGMTTEVLRNVYEIHAHLKDGTAPVIASRNVIPTALSDPHQPVKAWTAIFVTKDDRSPFDDFNEARAALANELHGNVLHDLGFTKKPSKKAQLFLDQIATSEPISAAEVGQLARLSIDDLMNVLTELDGVYIHQHNAGLISKIPELE